LAPLLSPVVFVSVSLVPMMAVRTVALVPLMVVPVALAAVEPGSPLGGTDR